MTTHWLRQPFWRTSGRRCVSRGMNCSDLRWVLLPSLQISIRQSSTRTTPVSGLSAAIFTENIDNALKFALNVDSGNLNINGGTQFRADLMPYGGLKDSGMGKEGPPYAVEEMTELKMVIVHRS